MKNFTRSVCLVFFLSLISSYEVFAQDDVTRINDTLAYKGVKYHPGLMIKLQYGSTATQQFAYVYFNSLGFPTTPLTPLYSSMYARVLEFEEIEGKLWIRCRLRDRNMRILVDLAGAVDKGELTLAAQQ